MIKREAANEFPDLPGVYLFKDINGEIIYIGKAGSLKKRVLQYFGPLESIKTQKLMENAHSVEYIITPNEVAALILESDLVKLHWPRYNILLKDDKNWLYIKITRDEFPSFKLVRKAEQDGARYYGPFTSARATRKSLVTLRRLFPIRKCEGDAKKQKICFDHHVGMCIAPCRGDVSKKDYGVLVKDIDLFLKGKYNDMLTSMEKTMADASENQEFEKAAIIRDRMEAVAKIIKEQRMILPSGFDKDVMGLAMEGGEAVIQVFLLRDGRMRGKENFVLWGVEGETREEIMGQFIRQYYRDSSFIPKEIVLSPRPSGIVEDWLRSYGKGIKITDPKRGGNVKLLGLAEKNALFYLRQHILKQKGQKITERGLLELKEKLGLSGLPRTIEAFDISNISGKMAVGSMVAFKDGRPDKKNYRRFKIRLAKGIDDFAMINEVIRRRYAKSELPDLILVDGGKGQLGSALLALGSLDMAPNGIIGLAKKEEEIYIPGRSEPLKLKESPGLYILKQVRDEAHRFAISYHRILRKKALRFSELDGIPGIGEKRKMALIKHFKSIEAIGDSNKEELIKVPGISKNIAKAIHDHFRS